ncbi:MAG: hypothetical protein RLZZ381_1599 [Cyanobacteriota bacterium]|jgi:hypothetical protein
MTIRETAITKLNQLPESLVQEVNDFIDFIAQKHQSQIVESKPESTPEKTWSQWFRTVDALEVSPPQPNSKFSELLIDKYRQQGLDL